MMFSIARKQLPARILTSQRRVISSIPSLYQFTEDEKMLKDAVSRFAAEKVKPLVAEMDEKEEIKPEIWKGLFEQGFMAVETESKHGGSNMSFMSAILVVEELAKIDPAVSVACDVQNTLVNTLFRKYGNSAIQDKYLPMLAADKVHFHFLRCFH